MNLPRLAVLRPITTAMLLISVLVLGGIAFSRLPLAFLPEVDAPFIGVQVPYPNSNPLQIEKEITKPVEEVLATIPGVKKMSSESSADQAQVFLEFDWGQDLDVVRMLVSEKMDQVEGDLPDGIGQVVIFSFNTNDIPVVEGRLSAKGVDLSQGYELLEARIVNRIRRVPGVARVTLGGVEPKEIYIDLVLDKIREHQVDVGKLIERLQGASSSLVLGQVEEGGLRYSARALGQFESLEELGAMVVDDRGLRLSDIAEISYEEPPIGYGRHLDGKFAIALEVYKESTANTVDTVRAVLDVIENDVNDDPLLQGINLFVWQNQADEIEGGIDGLKKAGLIGALLAILVLYFYLRRLDSTLIVSLSIPFSIIATCGVLYFMGKTLNMLSMMGLMLGVGMLVDNAIVVLESIDRRHRTEKDVRKAALSGAQNVAMAVTASTATSLIVFLPLIVGGKSDLTTWLGEMGIAIALALVCSLFSSLTLIPLMSAHFLRERQTKPFRILLWLEDRYVRTLAWTLHHKAKTFALLSVALIVGFLPFPTGLVKTAMFSGTVNKFIFLQCEFSDYFYKSDAERVINRLETYIEGHREEWGIASVYSFFEANRAQTTLTLAEFDRSDDEMNELRQKIREGLPVVPGVRFVFDNDSDEGGSATRFAVKFFGEDSEVLRDLAVEAKRRLETLEGIQDATTSFGKGRQEIQVRIDREKSRRMGMTARDVANIFSFTLGGMRLPRFQAGDKEVETWLALRLEDRSNLEDLRSLQIAPNGGRPILLGDIADFEMVDREESITRENRKVRVAVRATYEGEEWEDTKKEIEGLMSTLIMPTGYTWGWNDRIIEQENQSQQMAENFLLALILVYLVMASLFESLAQPFAILFSIPFAIPGAAWFLAATRTPFNLMSQIGLLILMGIVVNNGIVLLDHMNQLRKEGMGTEEAILRAGRDRMRAILMTASTTIIGLFPLAFGGSRVGGLFYYPLAITVMGGLMSSAVLTLLVLPYVNLLIEGLAAWGRRVWRASGSPSGVGQPLPEPIPVEARTERG